MKLVLAQPTKWTCSSQLRLSRVLGISAQKNVFSHFGYKHPSGSQLSWVIKQDKSVCYSICKTTENSGELEDSSAYIYILSNPKGLIPSEVILEIVNKRMAYNDPIIHISIYPLDPPPPPPR